MDFVQSATLLNNLKSDAVVCDSINFITDFDATRFVGTWYEQYHVEDSVEPSYMQCETAQYTNLDAEAGTFDIYNSYQTPFLGMMLPRIGVHAKGECASDAECKAIFFGNVPDYPNLTIVETDYENYAINYNCDTEANKVYVWINTRQPVVDADYLQSIYDRALELLPNFDYSTFMPQITQGDKCSYHSLENAAYFV